MSGRLLGPRETRGLGQAAPGAGDGRPASRAALVAAYGAVYLVWGSTYLGIKYAIETFPPFLMAGTRFVIAGGALYVWARLVGAGGGRERPGRGEWRAAFVVGALLFLCGNGGVTWAEGRISSGLAALLVATEPLWMVLQNWARPGGPRPTGRVALGVLVGLAGVWLLVSEGAGGAHADALGVLAVVGAAFAWALGSLYSVHAPRRSSPLLRSGMQMLAGGALLLAAGTASGEWARLRPEAVSLRSVVALAYLTVFGSVVAFTAYNWLLRNVATAHAATYAYVNPLVAVFLGWALGGEALTPRTLTAAAVITASVALITSYGGDGAESPRPSRADNPTRADDARAGAPVARRLTTRVARPALGPSAGGES